MALFCALKKKKKNGWYVQIIYYTSLGIYEICYKKKLFYFQLIQQSSYSGSFSLTCIPLAGKPTGWRRDETLQANKKLFGLPGYSRLWSIWGQSNYYLLFSYSCRWLSFSLGWLVILIFTPVTNLLLPVWIISTTYKFSLNVKGPSSLLRCIKCYELLT